MDFPNDLCANLPDGLCMEFQYDICVDFQNDLCANFQNFGITLGSPWHRLALLWQHLVVAIVVVAVAVAAIVRALVGKTRVAQCDWSKVGGQGKWTPTGQCTPCCAARETVKYQPSHHWFGERVRPVSPYCRRYVYRRGSHS